MGEVLMVGEYFTDLLRGSRPQKYSLPDYNDAVWTF